MPAASGRQPYWQQGTTTQWSARLASTCNSLVALGSATEQFLELYALLLLELGASMGRFLKTILKNIHCTEFLTLQPTISLHIYSENKPSKLSIGVRLFHTSSVLSPCTGPFLVLALSVASISG